MPYDLFGGYSPRKRRPIDKNVRDAVWFKYVGKDKTEKKCYCCGIRTIHYTNFQVGHNKAIAKGGNDNISNLRPICGQCNRGMKTMSIEQYRRKYFGKTSKKKDSEKRIKKVMIGETMLGAPIYKTFRLKKGEGVKKVRVDTDILGTPIYKFKKIKR